MGGESNQTRRRTALYVLGLFGSLLAVAMWGKIRFVTDLPRMAYAVPETKEILTLETDGSVDSIDDPEQTEVREPSQSEELEEIAPESGGF